MSKLSDKIVVVTGGTGALGKVVADFFLKSNATVIVTSSGKSTPNKYKTRRTKQSSKLELQIVDVTSETSIKSFSKKVFSKHKRIDILCNLVGGVSPKNNIEDVSLNDWNAMLTVNLQSCFLMTKMAIRSMKENGFGRIINIASKPAIIPEAKRGAYGVAKSGVIALTKTVAEEVKEFDDITVNAIAPSIIVTEENKKWGTSDDIKKWVTPEQIAEMILYLCSTSGSAINGKVIQMYGKV